ncbi:MAG: MCE family protein [Burkholderiales bacterium]|nr:MAG: MCE family protein [Burkholderiales bacterium]
MEAEAKYTYVGIAVVALIAALIGSVLWLKRAGTERDFARYTIFFQEQALDGLAVGSDVNMRGISVGRVLDYQLSPDKLNRARVEVRLDRRAPVRENTSAVITRNFVTGIAQIRLVTPEPAGPPLTEAPEGEHFPVIAEGKSDVAEITGRVTELGEMAGEVLQNLNRLFTTENRNAVGETLSNLRALTSNLDRQLAGLAGTLAEIRGTAGAFRETAAQISSASSRVGDGAVAVVEDTRALIADLRGVAEQTQRAVTQATQTLAAIESQIGAAARRVDDSAAHLDDQLLVAVTELRTSLATVQRSLDRLNDPRAALLGPEPSRLGPGEKLP